MIHTINYLLLLTKQIRLTAAGIMLNNGNTPNMIAGFPSPIRKQDMGLTLQQQGEKLLTSNS